MSDLDKVAQSIWRRNNLLLFGTDHPRVDWPDIEDRGHWLSLARAAIDAHLRALQLTEERRTNAMSSAGQTTNAKTGLTTFHSDIRYDVRLVSPWKEST